VTPLSRRAASWAVALVVLTGVVVFVVQGAARPADPSFRLGPGAPGTSLGARPGDPGGSPGTTSPRRRPIAPFGQVTFRVDYTGVLFATGASVSAARCALLADAPDEHAQGLMGRTDLAGHDGMLFRFDGDTDSTFYMKDTLIPLSIAWFDAQGRFVSSADMPPCGDEPVCPSYGADKPYRYALEVPQGELATLGIGPGTRLLVGEEQC
jgi:uncharacterized membrane protein (UPF0127 family)